MEKPNEGTSWFWKLFGGTLIGVLAVLVATLFNNLAQSQIAYKVELRTEIDKVRIELVEANKSISELKEKNAENRESIVSLTAMQAQLREWQTKIQEKVTAIEGLKEKATITEQSLMDLQTSLKELNKEVQMLREKMVLIEQKLNPQNEQTK